MTVAEPRRADARRNRERVIAAAAEVFAERGIEAGVPEIAELAGVGKGTVYRNFETKDDLIAAVLIERIRAWRRWLEEAAREEDPWEALTAFLMRAATCQASDRSTDLRMAPVVANPELQRERSLLTEDLEVLIARAQEQGRVRPDVTAADLRVMFGGVSRVLTDDGVKDPEAWRRYAGLVIDALRA